MGVDNITLTIGTPLIEVDIELNFNLSDSLVDFIDACLAELKE
ncbi:hypothetical protein [Neobacillus kokaensis]|uniref:Uncharacterized protein n=1 Tax=Neobacillus kokaensis TaxID=2759023 RepID=A0ABQ3MZ25_9BACI|nr:hypothetical protein [Neobacillus kokaensis]GHH96652.1 hypothetical protein AM1BK_01950 [Neobacillus kokaensis]